MSKCKTAIKLAISRLYYKVIIKPNNVQTSCYLYTITGRDDIISGNYIVPGFEPKTKEVIDTTYFLSPSILSIISFVLGCNT